MIHLINVYRPYNINSFKVPEREGELHFDPFESGLSREISMDPDGEDGFKDYTILQIPNCACEMSRIYREIYVCSKYPDISEIIPRDKYFSKYLLGTTKSSNIGSQNPAASASSETFSPQ